MSRRYRWETAAERAARRESAHRRGQWLLVALVFVAVVLWQAGYLDGRPNSFDAARFGERRSAAQEAGER